MDEHHHTMVVPKYPGDRGEQDPFVVDFTPGYVLRALNQLPKQGSTEPWRLSMNYLPDVRSVRHGNVAGRDLRFSRRSTTAPIASAT